MKSRVHVILGSSGRARGSLPAASGASTPGVTSTEVAIGGTTPLTGSASAYHVGRGVPAACFKYVNSQGGVNKRKIQRYLQGRRLRPGPDDASRRASSSSRT